MARSGERELPDIDGFIRERNYGPCKYVRATTPEARALIEAKIAEQRGAGKVPTWQSFARWLLAAEMPVNKETIRLHYSDGHDSDR